MTSHKPLLVSRRECLRNILLTAGAAGLGRWAGAAGERRPNILVIMSDEHNARVMGCAGNALARTPHLDALAARGVVFESAYTNSPLCVPSRLAFTSGKYVSRVSAWSNSCRLPASDQPTLPRLLGEAGYETVLCGKMHYDRRERYGFMKELAPMAHNNGTMDGTGTRRDPEDLTPEPGLSKRFDEFHPGEQSNQMDHDHKVTRSASQFIRARSAEDKPFFLLAGYITPHFPLIVPEAYWKHFEGKVPMPNIPEGYLDRLPLNYKHLRIGFNEEDVPPEIVKKGRELYYGLVEWMDEQIGELLNALGDSAVADNTLVIYTADHGENMGEHGLWFKNAMYDPAARIPLVISWPARWAGGQRRTAVCSTVDLARTIAEIAGAHAPEEWSGDSLVPVLDNPAAPWKDSAISEYYAHNIASGFVMLREGHLKYVYHTRIDDKHPAERELYDLKADPEELTNLAQQPAYKEAITRLHAKLLKELGEDPDTTEQRCRAELAKGYGAEIAAISPK